MVQITLNKMCNNDREREREREGERERERERERETDRQRQRERQTYMHSRLANYVRILHPENICDIVQAFKCQEKRYHMI